MFSNSTLNSFVCPIPICQPKAALGSILNIFQSTNSRSLAVPLSNGDWGIIYAEDILSLMSKTWFKNQLALISHPKSLSHQSNTPQIDVRDFDSLIVPAVVYQADTELQEFLNHISHNCLLDRQTEYLVVDRGRKLRGRLDRHKILKYLAVQTQKISTDASEAEFLNQVSSSIDRIAIPLKIESTAGKTLHFNASWQELMSKRAGARQAEAESSLNTELSQQRTLDEAVSPAETPLSSDDKSDCDRPQSSVNNILPIPNLDIQLKPNDRNIFDADLSFRARSPRAVNCDESDRAAGSKHKVPLVATARQNNSDRYWLVIGGSIPSRQTPPPVSSSPANESVSKLLASLTHQLKSPLTGIVGLASLLKEKQIGRLNQRQTQYANLIHSSSRKMMGIVNHILKLVNLTREKRSPELVNLELLCGQVYQQILTEVRATVAPADFQAEALEPEFTITGDKTTIVDREILSRILFHLMLETYEVDKSWQGLQFKISNSQQNSTVIEISRHSLQNSARGLATETISSETHSNLNLAIARYLSETIDSSIDSFYSAHYCQFTLQLSNTEVDGFLTNANLCEKKTQKSLTILCLYPELEAIDLRIDREVCRWDLPSCLSKGNRQLDRYCIIEADSLEQAHTLARIWQLDVIILDGYQIVEPSSYLRSLSESEYLSNLPLITLDAKTTEAGNQLKGLNVYPCLLPSKERRLEDLLQAIEIATES